MKKYLFFLLVFACIFNTVAQKVTTVYRPKLVVGIVVDQMRYDYLSKFYHRYGDDGFKRLLMEGFNCENAHFNYIPTKTAVGHASVYTGTTGANHGIIGNDWYDKFLKKSIYCVDDENYKAVGTEIAHEQKSPHRLLTTTITDELRLAQNMQGKTIALGLKDRSSVLPGGHTSNGSYWFLGKDEGKFITSTYYMNSLPDWVKRFNKKGPAQSYMKKKWETLYPIDTYAESIADDNPYEEKFRGEDKPVFPHDLKKLAADNGNFDMIKATPYGNTLLVEFAKAAIENEELGERGFTDFLAISFSSPDYIGHRFGVDSKEIQDTYLRLDQDIADLLNYLDEKVGKGEYSLFLTADHAAIQVPAYLKSQKIPAAYFNTLKFRTHIRNLAQKFYGSEEVIEYFSNWQIFLNKELLAEKNIKVEDVEQKFVEELINYEGIHRVVGAHTLQRGSFSQGLLKSLQNGYSQKYSGDVMIIPQPATTSYKKTGSTHGSGFSYDTQVPIIFYGKGIAKGRLKKRAEITDIVPTMSNLLQITVPNSSTGSVIEEVFE